VKSRSRLLLIATTFAFVLAATGVIAVFFASPAQAHSSTVTVLDGQVLVRHANGEFTPITDGDSVAGGDTIRTAAKSHGVLTFFDGTTVELEPDTEITITNLQASTAGDKIVEITQAAGRTWHVVTHLVSAKSRYEIRTDASTAAVRGTAFEVAVLADGTAQTTTTEGDVAVSAQGVEVHALASQMTTVTRGSPPPAAQPAPEAAVTVTITIDLTRNAVVTDASGRGVGVHNGVPIRYIPGSKVEVVDGKLVMTIPNAELGLLGTHITPDAASPGGTAPDAVTVHTQVFVKGGGVVASSLTSRPVENGIAKEAVVITDRGLLLMPNDDAKKMPGPRIGKAPSGPTGIFQSAPTVAPLISVASFRGSTPRPSDASKGLDLTTPAIIPYGTVRGTATPATLPPVIAPATPPREVRPVQSPSSTPGKFTPPADVFVPTIPAPKPLEIVPASPRVVAPTAPPTIAPTPPPPLLTTKPLEIATPSPSAPMIRTVPASVAPLPCVPTPLTTCRP
jgi:hypothetical protein